MIVADERSWPGRFIPDARNGLKRGLSGQRRSAIINNVMKISLFVLREPDSLFGFERKLPCPFSGTAGKHLRYDGRLSLKDQLGIRECRPMATVKKSARGFGSAKVVPAIGLHLLLADPHRHGALL
jgi:hypothetical protein